MFCNHCGKPIAEDARFCSHCGTVLGGAPLPKRMMRPRSGRTVAGVCAGMAHYMELDVTLVRLVWALVTVLSGIFPGAVVYAVSWIVIPEEPLALPSPYAGSQTATHP